MRMDIQVLVEAPREQVWRLASDIENSAATISGIEKIEVLERPEEGMLGLKWRETRTLFGKTAVETMWITEAVDGSHYVAEARSHGSAYRTKVFVDDAGDATRLGMEFHGRGETLVAKVLSTLLAPLMKSATRKALLQDLEDVKAAAEAETGTG